MVEDNPADVFLIRDAIRHAGVEGEVDVVRDGCKAIEFFEKADSDSSIPCPDLLLLDLNLPLKGGDEVLGHLRASRRCRQIPVLIVTSSDSERDRESSAALGATGYFRKPSNYEDFMKLGSAVQELLTDKRRQPID